MERDTENDAERGITVSKQEIRTSPHELEMLHKKRKKTPQRNVSSLRYEPSIIFEAGVDCLPTRRYRTPRYEQFCAVRLVTTPRTVHQVYFEQLCLLTARQGLK